jgi:hypothetical protein
MPLIDSLVENLLAAPPSCLAFMFEDATTGFGGYLLPASPQPNLRFIEKFQMLTTKMATRLAR